MDSATDLTLNHSLVQVRETGSSVAIEKEGLKQLLDKLLNKGVVILSVAADRCTGIASLMKKCYSYIEHQYDVWHIAKSVTQN